MKKMYRRKEMCVGGGENSKVKMSFLLLHCDPRKLTFHSTSSPLPINPILIEVFWSSIIESILNHKRFDPIQSNPKKNDKERNNKIWFKRSCCSKLTPSLGKFQSIRPISVQPSIIDWIRCDEMQSDQIQTQTLPPLDVELKPLVAARI